MKSLLSKIENGITEIEKGTISSLEMDELVQTAREVHERLLVVRYKLYEQQVFPERIHTPIDLVLDSFSDEKKSEIEKPIDFDLEQTEKEAIIENSSNEDSTSEEENIPVIEYTPNPHELFIDAVVEKPIDSDSPLDLPLEQEETNSTETELEPSENTTLKQESIPMEGELEVQTTDDLEQIAADESSEEQVAVSELQPSSSDFDLSKDETETSSSLNLTGKAKDFKTLENAIAAKSQIEKLETLIGSFTLNDKLLFINSLFDGSSDAFAKAVKSLDITLSMSDARIMLSSLADEYHWEMDNEVVEDFVYRICQRHADTLDQ